jgi:hypothetical protein
MDVFHVGASAPKAPETKTVDRDATSAKAAARSVDAGSDAFASSPDARAVARHVDKLAASPDTRADVVKGMQELLGRGAFDTPQAAKRAAQGILES